MVWVNLLSVYLNHLLVDPLGLPFALAMFLAWPPISFVSSAVLPTNRLFVTVLGSIPLSVKSFAFFCKSIKSLLVSVTVLINWPATSYALGDWLWLAKSSIPSKASLPLSTKW